MNMDSPRYIIYVAILASAGIYGLTVFKRVSKPYSLFPFYFLVIMFFEMLSKYMAYHDGNNKAVYHVLIPIQILAYTYFYLKAFKNKKTQFTVLGVGLLLTCFCICNSLFVQAVTDMPTYSFIVISTFVIVLSLIVFKKILEHPTKLKIFAHPLFWFNLGSLVFYCLTFFVFGYLDFMVNSPNWVSYIIWVSNMIMYITYFISFYSVVLNQVSIKKL